MIKNDNSNNILVVDLDGTLINSDILIECINQFLIKSPLNIFRLIYWIIFGKTYFKNKLSLNIDIDIEKLPYNFEVIEWLISLKKNTGVKLILATGSHHYYANKVSKYLNIFDFVVSSNEFINMRGYVKANTLINLYGFKNFDYIGNSWDDVPVWSNANKVFIVSTSLRFINYIRTKFNVDKYFHIKQPFFILEYIYAMRCYQWFKNLLIFIPLIASGQYYKSENIFLALMGFIIFSICASSVYILNDLVDINEDRLHKRKKKRPFASGSISIKTGWFLSPIFLLISLFMSYFFMNLWFSFSLIIYFLLTLIYTFIIKKIPILDVITLAALYTLRIIAGTLAFNQDISFWLLLFSIFIFLSLALLKRFVEINDVSFIEKNKTIPGRGYISADLEFVSYFGCSCGLISVLVFGLYIHDIQFLNKFSNPQFLWLICPILLYWIMRIWFLAFRSKMDDDPIFFALKDKVSWLIVSIFIFIFYIV